MLAFPQAKIGLPTWAIEALAAVGATLLAVFYLLAKGEKLGKADIQARTTAAVQKAQGQAQDVQQTVQDKPGGAGCERFGKQ